MSYAETVAQRHGIFTEGPAFQVLRNFLEKLGWNIIHASKSDIYGIDVVAEKDGKTIRIDIKAPDNKNKNSGKLSISYYKKNFGPTRKVDLFIDGNILVDEDYNRKSVALPPEDTPYRLKSNNKNNPGFFLVEKTKSLREVFIEDMHI